MKHQVILNSYTMCSPKIFRVKSAWGLMKTPRTIFFSFWTRVFFCLCFWLTYYFSSVLSGYISGQGSEEVLRSWLNLNSQLAVYYCQNRMSLLPVFLRFFCWEYAALLLQFSHRYFCSTHWIFVLVDTCTWSPFIWSELYLLIYVQKT